MKKVSARRNNKQAGMISPVLIVVGIVIVIIVAILLASGVLKFQGNITKSNNQSSLNQPSATTEEALTSKNKTYTNTASGISLEYPKDWSIKENPGAGVIVAFGSPKESSSDKFVDNVNISNADLSSKPNVTLTQLTDIWLKQTGSAPSFKLLDRKSTTLAGEAAEQLVYAFTNNGVDVKGMVIITMKNNMAYIVTYTAEQASYDKFISAANTIVNSLQIK